VSGFGAAVDGWAALAWGVTWQLAVLAVVVWLAERVLRVRDARVRHGLWWFVLLAPLVLTPGRLALARRQAVMRVAVPEATVRAVAAIPRLALPRPAMSPASYPATELSPAGPRGLPVRPVDGLALPWLVGCGLLGVRLVVGHRRVCGLAARSREVGDATALSMLARLCERAGVRVPVRLRTNQEVGAPLVYGWWRPAVLVHEAWLRAISSEDLRAVLAHEVAHIRRGDLAANLVRQVLEALLFFHPGAWLASQRIALATEELCDAWALSLDGDAEHYARTLTAMAERERERVAVTVAVAERRSMLLRRVEAIMRGEGGRKMKRSVMVVVATLVLSAAGALAAVQVAKEETPRRVASAAPEGAPLQAAPPATPAPADTEGALAAAGVRAQHYNYEAASAHSLRFTFQQYVGGEQVEWGLKEAELQSMGPGKQIFTLVTREHEGKVSFQFSNASGSSGGPAFGLQGYGGRSWGALRGELIPGRKVPIYALVGNALTLCGSAEAGRKVPIYAFVASKEGKAISGFSSTDRVEQIAARYDLAIVVMAEVKEEKSEAPPPAAPPGPAAGVEEPEVLFETITLRYWPAGYILYLFGAADFTMDSGPLPGLVEPSKALAPSAQAGSELAGMVGKPPTIGKGAGSLKAFLPEGIKLIATPSVFSQQLLVAGTPRAVASLRELIGMLDGRPQQVILGIMVHEGVPENGTRYSVAGAGAEMGIVYLPKGETEFRFAGRVLDAIRVATTNLVPTCHVVRVGTGPGRSQQTLITALPQILGDGTLNVVLQYQYQVLSDSDDAKAAIAGGSGLVATVNVGDGETFGVVVTRGDSTVTVTVTPQIVRE